MHRLPAFALVFALALATGCVEARHNGNTANPGAVSTPTAHTPDVQTQVVEYDCDGTTLEGYLAWDAALDGKRPGVIVVHQWTGLGDYEKQRARMLAELGYVAFAADIYGKGVRPASFEEAAAESSRYRGDDRTLLRNRANAALTRIREVELCDADNVGAIGYCFGGATVLEMARGGADLDGVVSFHGSLSNPNPDDVANITCSVLVLHGADDPHANMEEVNAFITEMRGTDIDWHLALYGNAVHSFTEEGADLPEMGVDYNAEADHRSWAHMQTFFAELFAR